MLFRSYPYDKFFNVGEENASEIDWDSAKVYEKLDGSIVTLYWYKGDWHFATSGMPAASAGCDGSTRFDSFRDLIETTWDLLGYRFPEDRAICYMFELMTPENRVIVSHSDFRMVLHGARELTGGFAELEPEPVAEKNGWWCVNLTPLKDLESVLEAAEGLKACEDEGYVVRDSQWRRIKLKAPEYLKVKWLKGEFVPHRMLEAVLENEISEVGAYFPDIAADMENLRGRLDAYSEEITKIFSALNSKTRDRKEFAKMALEYPYSGILFGMLSGKYPTPHEAFVTMQPKRLLEQL